MNFLFKILLTFYLKKKKGMVEHMGGEVGKSGV